MAIGRFPKGELDSAGTEDGRISSEEAGAEQTNEKFPIAALLKRLESTVQDGRDNPRYAVREDTDGWQVADLHTGFVAQVYGFVLAGLTLRRANSLADVLNRIDRKESI